ncbi:MAG: hypothetical protein K6E59_00690 [Bacilli bacterium]|nr:hypothetical protein [Bacilli bacterium]
MNEEETNLKIGRVARSTERALGISLTGEVAIYIEAEELDHIARKRPTDYLSFIEELGNILREPDFVSFQQEKQELLYLKAYYAKESLNVVCLTICRRGTPQRWFFKSLSSVGKIPLPISGKHAFARPINKKVSP